MNPKKLITTKEAADRSFQMAYLVAQAILTDKHKNCPGCAICDLIQMVRDDNHTPTVRQ